jgi:hypothetical protein
VAIITCCLASLGRACPKPVCLIGRVPSPPSSSYTARFTCHIKFLFPSCHPRQSENLNILMDKKIASEERRRHAEENDMSWNLHGLRETAMYSIVACSLCFVSHRARGLARARHLGTNDRTREFYGRMFFWHGRKHCLLRPTVSARWKRWLACTSTGTEPQLSA